MCHSLQYRFPSEFLFAMAKRSAIEIVFFCLIRHPTRNSHKSMMIFSLCLLPLFLHRCRRRRSPDFIEHKKIYEISMLECFSMLWMCLFYASVLCTYTHVNAMYWKSGAIQRCAAVCMLYGVSVCAIPFQYRSSCLMYWLIHTAECKYELKVWIESPQLKFKLNIFH